MILDKQKLEIYEDFFSLIHINMIAMNNKNIAKLLDNVRWKQRAWSGNNGTQSQKELEESIDFHILNLNKLD